MTLFTGKGDGGTTKLFNTKSGERISKDSIVFEALGTVDELNTVVGWCRVECGEKLGVGDKKISDILLDIQNSLFIIQAELAGANKNIENEKIKEMEETIGTIEKEIPPITTFLVPGVGVELSARLDMARAISRRAERVLVATSKKDTELSKEMLVYMNRLSSLFYALVRFVNYKTKIKEQAPKYGK